MPDSPRYRFAPSPTGFFHVGGARTALYNWALAKRTGGRFVLRIEDTDEARNRPEWTQGIVDALAWIGIGAGDPTFEGPYFQSSYAAAHVAAAERLHAEGRAYYTDLTGEQLQAAAASGGVPDDQGPGPGRALRFRVPDGVTVVRDQVRGEVEFANDTIEDFVLLRSNGTPVFLIANVVDDVEMGITHVVRAEEHLPNTPKQQLLWEALGHTPPSWAHVPVLVNEKRQKLSKRRDKVALEQYRDEGYLADAMVNYLMTLGWAPAGDSEIVPWSVVESTFRLEDVNHSPAFFDEKKLRAFNGDYIRALPVEEFVALAQPWLTGPAAPWPAERFDPAVFAAVAPLVQTRVATLGEVPAMVDFLFLASPELDCAALANATSNPAGGAVLRGFAAGAVDPVATPWTADALRDLLVRTGEANGLGLSKAQAPVRVAVTGRTVGPPLFESLEVLGREAVLARLRAAIELVDHLPADARVGEG